MLVPRRSADKVARWLLRAEKDERLVPAMSAEITGEIEACHQYVRDMEVELNVVECSERCLKVRIVELNEEISKKDEKIRIYAEAYGELPDK
jgi:hypothetical protein